MYRDNETANVKNRTQQAKSKYEIELKGKKDQYLLCSTRLEFMSPKQCKQECRISPLKRSRLTNNLNSLEIFDLESTKPKQGERKLEIKSWFRRKIKATSLYHIILKHLPFTHSVPRENTSFLICMTYLQSIFAGICGSEDELWVGSWL